MGFDYIKYRNDCKKNDDIRDFGLVTPDDIERFDNLKYGPDAKWNVLDVYRPKNDNNYLPLIINVHGGGWCYGDKELYQHYAMRLAQRGFVVVNYTYRLAPEYNYPAPLVDASYVFDFIVDNKDVYKIDINNSFMVGDSAGGQMNYQLNLILSNKEYAKLFDFKLNDKIKVRACCLNCGCYTFMTKPFGPLSMMKLYLGNAWKDYKETYNFKKYITKEYTPVFVMSSYGDFLKFMAKPIYNIFKKRGVDARCMIYGDKNTTEYVGHVLHVNCKTNIGKQINDDECNFFKSYIVK